MSINMNQVKSESEGTIKAFIGAVLIILVIVAGLATLFFGTGCATITEILTGATNITQKASTAVTKINDKFEYVTQPAKTNKTTSAKVSGDAVEYSSLKWAIGKASPAVASPAIVAEIKAGKASASTLYFSWVDSKAAGVALGSSTHEPAELRAYVFYGAVGGFFDWCSVTRASRGLENSNGVNWGWPSVDKAQRPLYFFVGSKDGRTRTNIVKFEVK